MLITNATGKKIRLSVTRDISEDDVEEKFAYIIQKECGLHIPDKEDYIISIEKEN